jgi:hypothetical protein
VDGLPGPSRHDPHGPTSPNAPMPVS